MIPEVGATEAIEEASSEDPIGAHLDVMFGDPSNPPPWDQEQAYGRDRVEMYYMTNAAQALTMEELATALRGSWPEGHEAKEIQRYGAEAVQAVLVKESETLGEVLRAPRHVIPGIPTFVVLAKGTPYRDQFLQSI